MFRREFHVKRGTSTFLYKGFFYLFMMLLSMLCCLFPKLYYVSEAYMYYIVYIGLSACIYFAFMFVYTVYTGIKPLDALILTEEGIYDFINEPKNGIFIDWTNVSSVKIFGSEKMPLLGIELYDIEIISEMVKKAKGEELRTNVESGLPAIIIKQSEIAPRLSQILPAFNDFISATRPIPIANSLSDNDDIADDPLLVVPEQIEKQHSGYISHEEDASPRTLRGAKNANEVFVLPNNSSIQSSQKERAARSIYDSAVVVPGLNNDVNTLPKTKPEEKNDSSDSSEDFPEFILEKEPSREQTLSNKNTETKEIPITPPTEEKSTVTEKTVLKKAPAEAEAAKKEAEEIKTLDELLSGFSVPTGKKLKDNK